MKVVFVILLGIFLCNGQLVMTNWGHTFYSQYIEHHEPETEVEIQEIVRYAFENGQTVGVQASRHAGSPIAMTTGHLMNLDKYSKLVSVDGDEVTFEAGIRMINVMAILEGLDRTFPNVAAILDPSIASILQTNSHGTGNTQGMSNFITHMRVITGNGSIIEVDESQPELFSAMKQGLGVMGIVSTITVRTVPQIYLTRWMQPIDIEEIPSLMLSAPTMYDRFRFRASNANPDADLWVYEVVDGPPSPGGCWGPVGQPDPVNCTDVLYRAVAPRFPTNFPGRYPHHLHEVMIDIRNASDFIAGWIEMERTTLSGAFEFVSTGQSMRFATADDILLSPFYGRDTAIFDMSTSYTDKDTFDMFADAWHDYCFQWGGRMHWGKESRYTPEQQRALYPDTFDTFVNLRRSIDPTGVFLNDWTADMFE